ncbi:hypothetical protein BCV69DRAFT_297728 [Microstroma glucosiphilum]|uniref:Methyltransferase domain-containing protein n=1 Tax=Pseudomicrostroma glucosiphilum TaxID=1684307 RepID=A0A316UB40_9BASI|nr:hypothetical protein BCV69DRAFT_297728 [Pseudomicrostroma glucosiphilum]PWN22437.1 hypothetical protein BCV69DRAFT_297728 [Pseudomicrostroma glucosiphilum]
MGESHHSSLSAYGQGPPSSHAPSDAAPQLYAPSIALRSSANAGPKAKRRPWSAGHASSPKPFGSFRSTGSPLLFQNTKHSHPTPPSSESGAFGSEQQKQQQPHSSSRLGSDSQSDVFSPLAMTTSAGPSSDVSPPKARVRMAGRGGAGAIAPANIYATNGGAAVNPSAGSSSTASAAGPSRSNTSDSNSRLLAGMPLSPISTSHREGRSTERGSGPYVHVSRSKSRGRYEQTFTQSKTSLMDGARPSLETRKSSDTDVTWLDAPSRPVRSPAWAEMPQPEPCDELQDQPFPVRLGLIPPFSQAELRQAQTASPAAPFRSQAGSTGARYVDGYYLYNPPPKIRRPATASRENSGNSGGAAMSTSSLDTLTRRTEEDERPRSTLHKMPSIHPLSNGGMRSSMKQHDVLAEESEDPALSSARWELDDYFVFSDYRTITGAKRRMRYHGYPKAVVPYILTHGSEAMRSELILHSVTYEALTQRHSLIPWGDAHPTKVLDLGTGSGAWCVDAARAWKNAEFIGLDVVPCQTPLDQLKDSDLQKRVSWVVANFLEELPFPTASFDFVHVRYIGAYSIQENQWDAFLTEVTRVLKPEGRLELLENNLTFVGNVTHVSVAKMRKAASGQPQVGSLTEQVPQPPRQFGAVEDAIERLLSRRFINSQVLSVIPTSLIVSDFRDLQIGNPRRMPLLVDPHDRATITQTDPSKIDWTKHFTSRAQIGQGLSNSGFAPKDVSGMLNLLTVHRAELFSSMRDLLWREAEEEKHTLLTRAAGHLGQGRMTGTTSEASHASWAHPWKNRAAFDKELDSLRDLLWKRADCGSLIAGALGWREGELESVEGRKMATRKEKMTKGINNAAPSLGSVASEHGSISDAGTNESALPRHLSQDSGADISPTSSGIPPAGGAAGTTGDRSSSPQRNARGSPEVYTPVAPPAGRRASSALSMSPAIRVKPAHSVPPRPSTSGSAGVFGDPRGGPLNQPVSNFPGSDTPFTVSDARRTSKVSSAASAGPEDKEEETAVPAMSQRRASSVAASVEGPPARKDSPAEPSYIGVLGFFESTGFTAKGKADESSAAIPRPFGGRAPSFSSHKGGADGPNSGVGAMGMANATPSQRASRLQPQSQSRNSSPQPSAATAGGTSAPPSPEIPTSATAAAAATPPGSNQAGAPS